MTDRREQLEAIARAAIQAQAAADWDQWLAMLTDDIRYETIGTTPASGVFEGKEALLGLEALVGDFIDGGIGISVDAVFVDDPTVVVQAHGESITRTARVPYNNTYCLVLRMRGHLIEEWIEYLDTALVEQVIESELEAQRREGGRYG